jgi:hypothetical protein
VLYEKYVGVCKRNEGSGIIVLEKVSSRRMAVHGRLTASRTWETPISGNGMSKMKICVTSHHLIL